MIRAPRTSPAKAPTNGARTARIMRHAPAPRAVLPSSGPDPRHSPRRPAARQRSAPRRARGCDPRAPAPRRARSRSRRIAMPASRRRRSSPCTCSMAPTSTPRVGWQTSSTVGSCERARARTSFCALPPDSCPAGLLIDAARMPNACTSRRAWASIAARSRMPARLKGGLWKRSSTRLSAIAKSRSSARPYRSEAT